MITWTAVEPGGANLPQDVSRILIPWDGLVFPAERYNEETFQVLCPAYALIPIEDMTYFTQINLPE